MDLRPHNEMDFPSRIWHPFAANRAPISCPAGSLIYLQGTEALCFYYLKEGRVKSFIQSEDGNERVLNIYEAGSLFGEASFLDELPRVSSAVALTPCQLVLIDREMVVQEISRDPELALAMMKYLARTVRLLSGHVDQMAFHPAKWRVAKYLLSHPANDERVQCTQDDIADSVSVSRVTVSRILNELSRQGLVELGYRTIRLLDRSALAELCSE
jgi:CRP/FNR family transcriptional regulator